MKIRVFIKPNSKQAPKIIKSDDFWTIFVKNQPIDNKANNEALEILAKDFKIAKSKIKLIKGHKARYKTFLILDKE